MGKGAILQYVSCFDICSINYNVGVKLPSKEIGWNNLNISKQNMCISMVTVLKLNGAFWTCGGCSDWSVILLSQYC